MGGLESKSARQLLLPTPPTPSRSIQKSRRARRGRGAQNNPLRTNRYSRGVRELPPELGEITARLVAEFDPEAVYLFGSYAWGEPDEDSDLDILVVVAESDTSPAKRMTRAHRALRDIRIPTDVLVKTQAEFERYRTVRTSLMAQIFYGGKKLYERAGRGRLELAPQS